MPALHELQAAFLYDIYAGTRRSAPYLAGGKPGSPERLDIYVNNALFGLTDVLAGAYPVVQKIVGEEFFQTIARHYIRAHPQASGNRHDFGAELATFLQDFKPAAKLPYLSDIAALEWACFRAGIADDAPPLNAADLSALMAADPDFVLKLHPSTRLIKTRFNALEIWQEHQKGEITRLTLRESPQSLAVWRNPHDELLFKSLNQPFQKLLVACPSGKSFAEAMAVATDGLQDFSSLQQEFAEALSLGLFTANKDMTDD